MGPEVQAGVGSECLRVSRHGDKWYGSGGESWSMESPRMGATERGEESVSSAPLSSTTISGSPPPTTAIEPRRIMPGGYTLDWLILEEKKLWLKSGGNHLNSYLDTTFLLINCNMVKVYTFHIYVCS